MYIDGNLGSIGCNYGVHSQTGHFYPCQSRWRFFNLQGAGVAACSNRLGYFTSHDRHHHCPENKADLRTVSPRNYREYLELISTPGSTRVVKSVRERHSLPKGGGGGEQNDRLCRVSPSFVGTNLDNSLRSIRRLDRMLIDRLYSLCVSLSVRVHIVFTPPGEKMISRTRSR